MSTDTRQNSTDRFDARAERAARHARNSERDGTRQSARYAARQYVPGSGMTQTDEV